MNHQNNNLQQKIILITTNYFMILKSGSASEHIVHTTNLNFKIGNWFF